ncbi:MAG TPA: P-loop NTPase fold protein [Smithella sp.]|nr:P-loop NTPase fold protein [Smithella sp.]
MVEQTIEAKTFNFTNYLPNINYFLIMIWLLLITIFNIISNLFVRYRNSYFLNQPDFLLIDALLIITITILSLCYVSHTLPSRASIYFWRPMISICVFIFFTYISATFPLIKKELNKYCAHENDTFPEQIKLFSDEPINDEMDDLIGRRNFASTLKEHIYDLSIEESFVMALYGRWGEGKTSILNLLKKEMREEPHLLIYEFDPWYFGDNEALTANFYYGLNDLLEEKYFLSKKIKNALTFYPEVLLKGFAIRFHKSVTDERPLEIKKDIEQFIASIDKKVLVVIDDIDRLQREQILAVFQLIKLTSKIKNMIFLLSFDPDKVAAAIKCTQEMRDSHDYIEKIVQLPINIPMTDQSIIDKFIYYSYPETGHISEIDKLFDR